MFAHCTGCCRLQPDLIGEMMSAMTPQKITFAEMRDSSVRGFLIYCADYRCSHSIAISGDGWPDDARLSDIEPSCICGARV
jgi:hypothetical protein